MTETKKNGNSGNTTLAGIAGAVIGAGVAVAATKVLSDKQTRNKVMHTISDVKDQVVDSLQNAKKDVKNIKEKASEKLEAGKKEVKKTSPATKK